VSVFSGIPQTVHVYLCLSVHVYLHVPDYLPDYLFLIISLIISMSLIVSFLQIIKKVSYLEIRLYLLPDNCPFNFLDLYQFRIFNHSHSTTDTHHTRCDRSWR